MERRTVLVTGATDGIGRATALELARRGARVLVHGRSERKCRAVADEVAAVANEPVPYLLADFASLAQVRRLAQDVRELAPKVGGLHVLVANAGVFNERRSVTEDGFEETFAVNHLAHFVLVNELLDVLDASAPARIVINSSQAHHRGHVDFEDLQHERRYEGYRAYADSKLENVFWGYELAERLDPRRITANSLHPGSISTKLLHVGWGRGGLPVEFGAQTPVYLSLSDDVVGVTGEYFVDKQPRRSSRESYDARVRRRLWQVSEELARVPAHAG